MIFKSALRASIACIPLIMAQAAWAAGPEAVPAGPEAVPAGPEAAPAGPEAAPAGPDAAPAAAAPVQDMPTQDIVVTAQRRSENLRSVPLSVTVASHQALEARNLTGPAQLPMLVPSLQITNYQASPGATNFSIRGIGTASFSNLVEPSVATVIDGIAMARPEMGVMEFADLERVEVLNGPQGMLFGKNASAGLVNIVTARPKLNQTTVDAEASYGNVDAATHADSWRANATVNVPIAETVAARISAYLANDGSLINNPDPNGYKDFGRKQYGFRGKLLWELTPDVTLYLSGDYTHSSGMGTGTYTARETTPGGTLAALDAACGVTPGPTNFQQCGNAPTDLQYNVGGAQGQLDWNLGNGITLTDIAGWRSYDSAHTIDFDLSQDNIVDASQVRLHFRQFSNELRLSSGTGKPIEWQAGFYYLHGISDRHDNLAGDLDLGPTPAGYTTWLGIHAQNNLITNSYAGYGQATWHTTDKLSLTGGVRVTHDQLSFDGTHDYNGIVIGIAGDGGPHTYIESQGHTDFSWRLSGRYEWTPKISSYVTVAHGYKGPGYNLSWSGNPGGLPVGAETSMDYEIGTKALLGNLRIDVALYWENFSNFQTQSYRATDQVGVGSFVIQNAGSLRSRGVEGNFSYKVDPHLTFSGGGAFNDAVYTRFDGAPCYASQTAAQGCINGTVDASGNRLTNAPKWTGNFALDYDTPVSATLRVFAHADVYAHTGVNFSSNDDPHTYQKGYAILNGSLGLGELDRKWQISVFCRNCANQHYVTFIESNSAGSTLDYAQSFALDSFRTIGVKLATHF